MLRVIKTLSEAPSVEQYMFIFLKFMQSVVPTIEFDYTLEAQLR